jgi:hypothetical protein
MSHHVSTDVNVTSVLMDVQELLARDAMSTAYHIMSVLT